MEETSHSPAQDTRPGSSSMRPESTKQSNVTAQKTQPAQGAPALRLVADKLDDEPEHYTKEWYNDQVARGKKKKDLPLWVIWGGLGVPEEELRSEMRKKAQSLVDSDLAQQKLKKGKKSREMEKAVEEMENTFGGRILQRRENATTEFRHSCWYKLVRHGRYNHPEYKAINAEDTDETYVEEDSSVDIPERHSTRPRTSNGLPAATAPMGSGLRPNGVLDQPRHSLEQNRNMEIARCRAFESVTPAPESQREGGNDFRDSAKAPVIDHSKENMIDGLTDSSPVKRPTTSTTSPGKSVRGVQVQREIKQFLTPKGKQGNDRLANRTVSFKEAISPGIDPSRTLKRPRSASDSLKKLDIEDTPSKKTKGSSKAISSPSKNCAMQAEHNDTDFDMGDSDAIELPEVEQVLKDFRPLSPKNTPAKPPKTPTKHTENNPRQKTKESAKSSQPEQSKATSNLKIEASASRRSPDVSNRESDDAKEKAKNGDNNFSAVAAKATPETNSRIIPGFTPTMIEPHGKVRLGFLHDRNYTVLHEGEFADDNIEDIFDRFAASTTAVLTCMEITLHESCAISDLGIPKVRVPRKGPYLQLEEFLMQSALRERSQAGLDFVVAPVAVADFYKRRQKV